VGTAGYPGVPRAHDFPGGSGLPTAGTGAEVPVLLGRGRGGLEHGPVPIDEDFDRCRVASESFVVAENDLAGAAGDSDEEDLRTYIEYRSSEGTLVVAGRVGITLPFCFPTPLRRLVFNNVLAGLPSQMLQTCCDGPLIVDRRRTYRIHGFGPLGSGTL
jgi:hypothetical protein